MATRDIGENVFLQDLSDEYKVFLFFYPSAMRNEALESALRGLGELAGKNLFVNIGKLNDPAFQKIVKAFEITKYPVVVVTAKKELAGTSHQDGTVYVRIDDPRLLAEAPRTAEVVQEIFGLFLRGEIAAAISAVRSNQRAELVRAVGNTLVSGLRTVTGFIAGYDIKVSVMGGSFELTKSTS